MSKIDDYTSQHGERRQKDHQVERNFTGLTQGVTAFGRGVLNAAAATTEAFRYIEVVCKDINENNFTSKLKAWETEILAAIKKYNPNIEITMDCLLKSPKGLTKLYFFDTTNPEWFSKGNWVDDHNRTRIGHYLFTDKETRSFSNIIQDDVFIKTQFQPYSCFLRKNETGIKMVISKDGLRAFLKNEVTCPEPMVGSQPTGGRQRKSRKNYKKVKSVKLIRSTKRSSGSRKYMSRK